MPAWLTIMANPSNKARKTRKAPSVKQRANWARFAAMARARARQLRQGVSVKKSNPPRSGGSVMKRKNRKSVTRVIVRRVGSRGRAAMIRSGFVSIETLGIATGGVVGLSLPGKTIDWIPWAYIKTGWPRIAAKPAIAGLVAGALMAAHHFTKWRPLKILAQGVAIGGTIGLVLDVTHRVAPNLAPGINGEDDLMAGDEDDAGGVGEMVVVPAPQLTGAGTLGSIGPALIDSSYAA